MKAIIVSDAELNALLDKLKLESMRDDNHIGRPNDPTVDAVHRAFHYVVVRWIQSVGGEVSRG